MARVLVYCALLLGLSASAGAADDRAILAHARSLYNSGDYDAAITAADEARRVPAQADSADLIAARALLERFRMTAAPEDLRKPAIVCVISPPTCSPIANVSSSLSVSAKRCSLDDAPGAAASVFESVLETHIAPLVDGRELVLDWWASAMDHDARPRTEFERRALYDRVRVRMRKGTRRSSDERHGSLLGGCCARGQGDYAGAWAEAQAGWVRAAMATDHGAAIPWRHRSSRAARRHPRTRSRATGQSPDRCAKVEAFKDALEQVGNQRLLIGNC